MSTVDGLRKVVAKLRAQGVVVHEVPGWENRGKGGPMPVLGMVQHHTGGGASGDAPSLRVVTFGRPDLRNSLSMWFVSRSGIAYLVAAGVSWHAGRSSWRGMNSLNYRFAGTEAEHTGNPGHPWSEGSLRTQAAITATMCDVFGSPVANVAEHKEVCVPRGRKPDRVSISGNTWRNRIEDELNPAPWQPPQEDEEMLRPGDKGPNVAFWRHRLGIAVKDRYKKTKIADLNPKKLPKGWSTEPASEFGGGMKAVLNRYKKSHGLAEDGVLDGTAMHAIEEHVS